MYTAEEQAEHRKQWVAALRSAEYKQGKDRLRMGDKFCCLGVACDISGLGKWVKGMIYKSSMGYAKSSLPGDVADWLGINRGDDLVHIGIGFKRNTLAYLNDSGVDFNRIADIIEKNEQQFVNRWQNLQE